MPRPKFKGPVNLSDHTMNLRLQSFVAACKGDYRVNIAPQGRTRSLSQNGYYFAVVVNSLFQFLQSQDYDISDADDAHEILKAKFLAVAVRSPKTGERIGTRVGSTANLTTVEFSEYVEKCRTWLNEMFSIPTPDPGEHEFSQQPEKVQ